MSDPTLLKPDKIPPITGAASESEAGIAIDAKPEGYLRGYFFDWNNIDKHILKNILI